MPPTKKINGPRDPAQNLRARWITAAQFAALQSARTTAHRLGSSPGGWVERFGEDALLSYKDGETRDALVAELGQWSAENEFRCRRVFGKHLPKHNAERIAPVLLAGAADEALETVVEECGVRFAIDFAAGYSAGLFIDQRANRALVRRAGVRRLLNTFAYTCSFSVVAALAGAETVSIDLSKRSLDRGRANFGLNAIDPAGHRFLADDVLDVLPRLARRGEQFDCIVLDPPTFSRGNKGRRWQVEQGMEELLLAALEVATKDARILLSTNCARLPTRALEQIARHCLKTARRGGSLHREPPLPDVPADLGAQTLWLLLR